MKYLGTEKYAESAFGQIPIQEKYYAAGKAASGLVVEDMDKPGQAEYAEAVIQTILTEIFIKNRGILNDSQQKLIIEKCSDEVFSRFNSIKEI